jgi:hypothetical protein
MAPLAYRKIFTSLHFALQKKDTARDGKPRSKSPSSINTLTTTFPLLKHEAHSALLEKHTIASPQPK